MQPLPFDQIPFNSLSWGFGAVTALFFGLKSLRVFRTGGGTSARLFGWFGVIAAQALALFAIPACFLVDPDVIQKGYLYGDLLIYVGLFLLLRLLWLLGLQKKIKFAPLAVIYISLATWAWILEWWFGQLTVANEFQYYSTSVPSSFVQGCLFGGILIPTGYYLMTAGSKQLKSTVIGIGFILIGISKMISNFIFAGSDTRLTSTLNLLVFVIVFIVLLLPSKRGDEAIGSIRTAPRKKPRR